MNSMLSSQEHQEDYQRAIVWIGEQIQAAERQGFTLDYLAGWHTFQPDQKDLEHAWRVLYSIPDSMVHLLTPLAWQWEQVLLRWLRHYQERG